MKKLSIKDKAAALKKLKGWKPVKNRNAITKQFVFNDFIQIVHGFYGVSLFSNNKK